MDAQKYPLNPLKYLQFSLRVLVLYLLALFTHLTGCNFYYLEPSTVDFPHLEVPEQVQKIAFASCNNDNRQSGVFTSIANLSPDLFVWTGDIIYPDRPIPWPGNNLDKIAHKYARLQQQYSYRLLAQSVPVTGIWDDHDFGRNNGGANYTWKSESSNLFRRFMGAAPADFPDSAAIYRSYHLHSGSLQYSLILLDTRYSREQPAKDAHLLGAAQWEWLEQELRRPAADLLVLVSGTSVLSNDNENEGWSDYPLERKKLYNILQDVQKPFVIIAGDKHFAEINTQHVLGKEVHELIASGVTHTERPGKRYTNAIASSEHYEGINFGWMEIGEDGTVLLEAMDEAGRVRLTKTIVFPIFLTSSGSASETRPG